MKKVMLFVALLGLLCVAAGKPPEIITWDRPHADQLIVKAAEWFCLADFSADEPTVECHTDFDMGTPAPDGVTAQVLSVSVNDGYYLIVIHDECGTGTTAIAYNPDADTCRVFEQYHLFE